MGWRISLEPCMRRRLVLFVLLTISLVSFPAAPRGQLSITLPTVSLDLTRPRPAGERVRVIVQAEDDGLLRVRSRTGRGVRRELRGAVAVEVTQDELAAMTRDGSLRHISGDLEVRADMAVTNKTTAAEQVWESSSGLLGLFSTPGYTGGGITVAVVDSGIAWHSAIGDRVIARVNFVSAEPGVSGDPFGHGTHVAGMIGGSGGAARRVTDAYTGGSAPSIRFVDVRVLGRDGRGLTSDVIAGIDWTVANATRYGIRVINLSLGHPVAEPAATDPLCRAVERAVRAGLVVVVSAGNYGRTPAGQYVLGGITSPGNSPHAITVGATDTRGTSKRSDDRVAAFSSRGPTAFDLAVKPDVVAPGSRVVSLEAYSSLLSRTQPSWHVAGWGRNAYMRLSGTSMAAAVVSGGVALLLDAEPDLTPTQVKIALQMGASFIPDAALIGGGTGSVDFDASLELAQQGLVGSLLDTVGGLLGQSNGAAYRDAGTMIDRVYNGTGISLLGSLTAPLFWRLADSSEWGVLNLLGLNNVLALEPANRLLWGEVSGWTDSYYVVWGSTIQDPNGQYVVWGSQYSDPNYVVWGSNLAPQD
jgi:serine protease AprX